MPLTQAVHGAATATMGMCVWPECGACGAPGVRGVCRLWRVSPLACEACARHVRKQRQTARARDLNGRKEP